MAIPVIQTSSEQKESSNTTSSTITAPSGITNGDLLIITLSTDGDMPSSSITWPTSFTPIEEVNNGTRTSANAAWKLAASESGNYDVSWTSSEQAILFMYRVNGVVQIAGDEIQNPSETNTGTSALPTITPIKATDTDDSLVFVVFGMDDDDITEDGGGDADYNVEDVDRSDTGSNTGSGGVQTKGLATRATPPQCDLTLTASEEWAVFWFAVRSLKKPIIVTVPTAALTLTGLAPTYTTGGELKVVVGASADDGDEDSGSVNQIRGTVRARSGVEKDSLYRFTNITIPKDATILSVIFLPYHLTFTDQDVDFYFEAIDDSLDLTATNDIDGRSKTTASVNWTETLTSGQHNPSPDLKVPFQEVIDRGGWVSGNAVSLIAVAQVTLSPDTISFDHSTLPSAHLDILYETTVEESTRRIFITSS